GDSARHRHLRPVALGAYSELYETRPSTQERQMKDKLHEGLYANPEEPPNPGEGINSITDLLQDNVMPLVITVVGIFAFMAARRGEISNVLTTLICVVFGIAILVFALP